MQPLNVSSIFIKHYLVSDNVMCFIAFIGQWPFIILKFTIPYSIRMKVHGFGGGWREVCITTLHPGINHKNGVANIKYLIWAIVLVHFARSLKKECTVTKS